MDKSYGIAKGWPMAAGQLAGVPSINSLRGLLRAGGSASISASFANKTYSLVLQSARPFSRIRLHSIGLGAANGITAAVAPSNSAANLNVPSGGVASFTAIPFTTNGNTHAASSVGAGSSAVPVLTVSDWVSVTSVARTDGGSGYLLYLRYYEDATSAGNRCVMATTGPTDLTYGWSSALSAAGDFTTTTGTFTANTSGAPVMVEFESSVVGKTISWVGDSTIEGREVNSLRTHCAGRLALDALVASGHVLDYCNLGWNGSTTGGATGTPPATVSGYYQQFQTILAGVAKLPDIICFQPASVNNVYNAWNSGEATYWSNTFVSWAQGQGVTPVLVTPLPVDGLTSGTETNRRACVTAIKGRATALGVQVIDRDAALTNYSVNTGGYLSPSYTFDGTHPTAAGAAIEQPYWQSVFTALGA